MCIRDRFYAERDVYSENITELGLLTSTQRYICVLGRSGDILGSAPNADALAAQLRSRVPDLGVTGKCPRCSATAACGANLDDDDEIDIWTISTVERTVNGA